MRVIIKDSKLILLTERKFIHFDLPKDVSNNLKHEIDYIIKHNESLAETTIKARLANYSTQKTVKQTNHTNLFLTCHRD